MTRTTDRAASGFAHTLNGFAALGAAFGIELAEEPEETRSRDGGDDPSTEETAAPARGDAAPGSGDSETHRDPAGRLAGVKALGVALAARRERDRADRAAAFRELAGHDDLLAEVRMLERDLAEAGALRAEFEDALATPFDEPAWLYDRALREAYAHAAAEAGDAEAALARLLEDKQREVERLAALPVVARLLAERRRHEERARENENAAEAKRRRSQTLASAASLRDAGSFEEARRVLGPIVSGFPDDPEVHSLHESIDRAERAAKDAEATTLLAEARRLRRTDPAGAGALIASLDTTLLSADRMHEVAGVAAAIARGRNLVNPRFLRGRTPNSLAIIAEERGQWEVAVAVGRDPALQTGNVVPPGLADAARPLHTRR